MDDIIAARARIRDSVSLTPCRHSRRLSHLLGCDIFLKLENLQQTGSFKDRGALNKVLQMNDDQRRAGVVAASAGNHAQAVAYAAQRHGIHATIVMPETAPLTKVLGTQAFGADVILQGSSFDDAYAKALELQAQKGLTLIHAFDDPDVIAGQGTVGLELLEQLPDVDVVVVPVGGGGLIAGMALAVKETRPQVRFAGVQTMRMPSMKESLALGHPTALRPTGTIADGIAIAWAGKYTFPLVQRYVSEIALVSENEIAAAVTLLLEAEKTLSEGAGSVGVAALCHNRISGWQGKKVVVVISGGNIDMSTLSLLLERGLETDGRLARLRVIVPDKPGSIAALASAVAKHRANILHIFQDRHVGEVELGEIEVELNLETKGREHVQSIIGSVQELGFKVVWPHRGLAEEYSLP